MVINYGRNRKNKDNTKAQKLPFAIRSSIAEGNIPPAQYNAADIRQTTMGSRKNVIKGSKVNKKQTSTSTLETKPCNNIASDLYISLEQPPVSKQKWIDMNSRDSKMKGHGRNYAKKRSKLRCRKSNIKASKCNSRRQTSQCSIGDSKCCSNEEDIGCKSCGSSNINSCADKQRHIPLPSKYEVELKKEYDQKQVDRINEARAAKHEKFLRCKQKHQDELDRQRHLQSMQYSQLAHKYHQDKLSFQEFAKDSTQREENYRKELLEKAREDKCAFEDKLRAAYTSRMNRRLREIESKYKKVLLKERSSNRKQMRDICKNFSREMMPVCRVVQNQTPICIPTRICKPNVCPSYPPPCPPPCPSQVYSSHRRKRSSHGRRSASHRSKY